MDQINIFARYPRTAWTGVILSFGIFGTIFPFSPAISAAATLVSIAGLWMLFTLALLVERRAKYATVGLFVFGLFLLSVSTVLPQLVAVIAEAL